MNICLFGASSENINKLYFEEVEKLGKMMADRGHSMVFGGGATGLMGAAVRGLTAAGGKSIGIAPRFFDQPGILFQDCTEFIYTDTMRQRKQKMEDLSDAFIIVPGGIGTFEEFFEILTLKQLGQHNKPIAIFNVNNYYDNLVSSIQKATEEGFFSEKHLDIFKVTDNATELLDYIEIR
ncbi:MAG: TIGR00730 family Rossman fold protein [Firmicutes bacterium]|nr:TIGR00730 family Rossman fold protein [Bacillota bacterium]